MTVLQAGIPFNVKYARLHYRVNTITEHIDPPTTVHARDATSLPITPASIGRDSQDVDEGVAPYITVGSPMVTENYTNAKSAAGGRNTENTYIRMICRAQFFFNLIFLLKLKNL